MAQNRQEAMYGILAGNRIGGKELAEIIVSRVSSNSGKPRSDRYVILYVTNEKSLFSHVTQIS